MWNIARFNSIETTSAETLKTMKICNILLLASFLCSTSAVVQAQSLESDSRLEYQVIKLDSGFTCEDPKDGSTPPVDLCNTCKELGDLKLLKKCVFPAPPGGSTGISDEGTKIPGGGASTN